MHLIPIFSFLENHINGGGFFTIKEKNEPKMLVSFVLLYEKEFGKININFHNYIDMYGISESKKILINNLIGDYLSKVNQEYFKVMNGEKETNILYHYIKELEDYVNCIIENFEKNILPNRNISFDDKLKLLVAKYPFWKSIPSEKFIEHFKLLTIKKSKNDSVFLTESQLFFFVEKVLSENSELPKQHFNIANGEKGLIIKHFFSFYNICITRYSYVSKHHDFINLIIDNFDTGWTYTSIKDLFKETKIRKSIL